MDVAPGNMGGLGHTQLILGSLTLEAFSNLNSVFILGLSDADDIY